MSGPPLITIEGLTKSFGGQPVLKGVDLEVADGSITIIVGQSGGGKSVLLKHLISLLQPDRGRVVVAGVDVTRLRGRRLDAIRRRYGVVFQGGALFDSMTCFDNVAFPLREKLGLGRSAAGPRVEAALARVGLAEIGRKYPAEVSGGMRKRVAIARALVTDPEILFLDEPTTGLDPVLLNTIHALIVGLQRQTGFTVVMVSHDIPEIFAVAHTVAMLADGRIVETGSPAAIQASANPVVRRFIRGEPDHAL